MPSQAQEAAVEPFTFLFRVSSKADDGHVLSWNGKCEEVLGYRKDDIMGRVWTDILVPEYREATTAALERFKPTGGGHVFLPLVAASGERCVAMMDLAWRPKSATISCIAHTPFGSKGPLGIGESNADMESAWPLDVRAVPGAGLAAFARRDLEAGAMIVEEEIFFYRLRPAAAQERPEWDDQWARTFDAISEPLQFPGDDAESATPLFASPALVRNALGFSQAPLHVKRPLLSLYSPPPDFDHALVRVARRLAELCKDRLPECGCFDVELLQQAILTQELNVFHGGRVYLFLSRVNHSCAPNAVYISMPGRGGLKALRPIQAGEEVCISYLGGELLYSTEQRQRLLWRTKLFVCGCARCAAEVDPLRDRPCMQCAEAKVAFSFRIVNPDGVQRYEAPSAEAARLDIIEHSTVVLTTGGKLSNAEGNWVELDAGGWVLFQKRLLGSRLADPQLQRVLPERAQRGRLVKKYLSLMETKVGGPSGNNWYDRDDVEKFRLPEGVIALPSWKQAAGPGVAYARFRGGRWCCPRCGAQDGSAALLRAEREICRAAQHVFAWDMCQHGTRVALPHSTGVTLVKDAFLVQALTLADDAMSLLGRRHWAAQLGFLFATDLDLSLSRCNKVAQAKTSGDASHMLATVAGLLEMWDWLSSLDLTQEPGCWLYTRAARILEIFGTTLEGSGWLQLQEACEELRARVERDAPVADLLGKREFLCSNAIGGMM